MQENKYIFIPREVIESKLEFLTTGDVKILFIFYFLISGKNTDTITISKKKLMEISGMSRDTVRKAIKKLEEQNLIIVKKNSLGDAIYEQNSYKLLII